MTPDEEAAYVREVAEQKTAALRMSLDAVERQGMPFVGESGRGGAGRRGWDRAASAGRRDAPGRPSADRAGLPTDRLSPSASPRPAGGQTPISTTTRPGRPAPEKMQR